MATLKFEKILIANRGEIACRIIRSARRMGLQTVAVYSSADRQALHFSMADESIWIGPPPAAESYLSVDRIVEACKTSGAAAVHPGYGFLSENGDFAERLAAEGITFIGPPAAAIGSMGDKITAKKLAAAAGVSTIPGHPDAVEDTGQAVAAAKEIGYPVMLKASAGGGGKGMRIARGDKECREAFKLAASEAESAFGDGRLFLEKYIERPRHIEIQVLADQHGNVIHLGERECSLQRRHQKVIEEAPSPFLDESTRNAMGEQAVALARAVAYESAGTVEFIVDADRNFYFLEMNTRLQVEHPVTEFVTGLDLVEQMIRIASGEPLSLRQEEVALRGWAIEARIYAEDPRRNFLPSTGRLTRFQPPAEDDGLRVDTGVFEGGEVSMFYDPMIAKLIASGANRSEAIQRLRAGLNEFYIQGVSHNIAFLSELAQSPHFFDGDMDTNLIGEEYPEGFDPALRESGELPQLIAIAATIHRRDCDRRARLGDTALGAQATMPFVVVIGQEQHDVETRIDDGDSVVTYNGNEYRVSTEHRFGEPLIFAAVNDQSYCAQFERRDLAYHLYRDGALVEMKILTRRAAELLKRMPVKEPPDLSKYLLSPMPGLLAEVRVADGQKVREGQDLAVVEAMKMQNVLRASCDGVVGRVCATVGETLSVDQKILEFE